MSTWHPAHFKTLSRKIKSYRPWISPKEILYTIPAGIHLLICIYFVYIVISYVDRTNPSIQIEVASRTRLLDPLLDLLNKPFDSINLPKNTPDILVIFAAILITLRVLFNGRRTLLLARRVCYVIGTMYLLRAPFIIMTYLPNPLLYCQSKPEPNIYFDALLLLTQQRASCGDVLFSGHTVLFMMAGMLYVDYPIFTNNYLQTITSFIFISFSFLGCLSLIASAYHYTVDVAVAVFFTFTVWKFYHLVVTSSIFDHTWYGKMLQTIDQEHFIKFQSLSGDENREMDYSA